jgi:hypothetical protein
MRRDVQVIGIVEVETFSIRSEIGDISRVLHSFHACLCRTAFPQVQQVGLREGTRTVEGRDSVDIQGDSPLSS